MNDPLIGRWVTDPEDTESIQEYGQVSLDFKPGGVLEYTIHLSGKRQIMFLSYRTEGESIVTNQPSAPREERTPFSITDGKLYLSFGGISSRYVKAPMQSAPPH